MDDPSKMSDEELDAAISGAQPEETPTNEETPVDPPQEETPVETPPVEETPAEEPAPEEKPQEDGEQPPSRREQLRVQKLLEKYGPPPEKPVKAEPSQQPPDYSQLLDPETDPSVIEQFNKTAAEYGQAERNAGANDTLRQLQTVEWRTNLRIDNQVVEQKFPQLNKNDNEKFHSVLADAMNRRYLAMVGFNPQTGLVENPNVSYLDFVESEFELADEIASTKTADTVKNITKQAAQTGLRPDGTATRSLDLTKSAADMTDEELDTVISNVTRDNRGRFTKR